ncbi:hypothetical protein FisN_2Hh309 [Fistulifera solaris]|uniref:BAR domain-containing protein n=1 Tax=Fistulifera solaris TaxID=1519565 RepID=A0A1Z5KKZ1_FISSO|nr:hypothetical protein FisN_2Hh309 [Fistulifera solaris]|eukprot:GAX26742.1 hypothetical protein FisN_2Hh309 [Fistulifera solaris]
MGKTRVGAIVREAVGTKGSANNQSADLQALTEKYKVFCKNVKGLVNSLQQHHATLAQIGKTRLAVAQSVAVFSKNTPLWDAGGQMPGADRPAETVCSYASIHDKLAAKHNGYVQKYQQFILQYVVEWEKTVTTRVENGLKKVEEQRRELNHYQKKVETLRTSSNKVLTSGKSLKGEQAEKLKRNEEKLIAAKQSYNKMSSALCILMDEISERYWRDLHPVMIKATQFDMTIASDEAKITTELNQVVSKLKQVADQNGITAQDRLKDLGSLNPELLSTRPGGVAGFAALEADTSMPLGGSLSSGGIFGTGGAISRDSSFGSFDVPPTSGNSSGFNPIPAMATMSLQQQLAPPPTLDDVYGSSMYGAPPAAPYNPSASFSAPPMISSFGSGSFSADSTSGGAAPPPAGPPPPPPPGGYGQAMVSAPASMPSPYALDPYATAPAPSWGAPPTPSSQYSMPPPPPNNFASASPSSSYGAPPPSYGAPPAYGNAPPPYGAPPSPYGAPPPAANSNPFHY